MARSYANIGLKLVSDEDYCTPEELRVSPLLYELSDITEPVSDDELAAGCNRPNPINEMQRCQNAILNVARGLDGTVENFNHLDSLVQEHPEWDAEIAKAYRDCGYLDLWKIDFQVNPWHYDVELLGTDFDGRKGSRDQGLFRLYNP